MCLRMTGILLTSEYWGEELTEGWFLTPGNDVLLAPGSSHERITVEL